MRVYLPSTLAALAGRWPAASADPAASLVDAGTAAYAVTPALREWYREGDVEELEYVALSHAARASLLLLANEVGIGPARRVVVAADVPDASSSGQGQVDIAAVLLPMPVTVSMLAAVHVDDPAVCDEVAAAAAVALAAQDGDDDARFVLDSLDDHELQWYAVQELPFLLS